MRNDLLLRDKGPLRITAHPFAQVLGYKRGMGMIDWQRVDVLQSEVGEDGFLEVVELFLEETDDVIARLSEVPYRGRLSADLHFLKGSALNLGFTELADICAECERHVNSGEVGKIDLATLSQIYQKSKAEFLRRLAQTRAA